MSVKMTEAIRTHLQFLMQDGRLTPDLVVADAKKEDSPIHSCFTWNIQEAAELCWLNEARALIRSVKVVVTVENVPMKVPYYVPDPMKVNDREQGYTNLDLLRQDPKSARLSLLAECDRAASGLRRARLIAVALGLESQVDAILAHVSDLHVALTEENV